MVLTNLEIKLEQTDLAINYFLKYLLFADDHKICQNEIVSHPPTSASLWWGGSKAGEGPSQYQDAQEPTINISGIFQAFFGFIALTYKSKNFVRQDKNSVA